MSPDVIEDDLLWPDPDDGPWRIFLTLQLVDGRMQCVGLKIAQRRDHAAVPLTSVALRLPLATLVTDAVRIRRQGLETLAYVRSRDPRPDEELLSEAAVLAETASGRPRGRRAHRDDRHYERVAEVYRKGLESRSAIKYVMQHADEYPVSIDLAKKWIQEARRRGYLPATTQGRARVFDVIPESGAGEGQQHHADQQ